MKVVEEKIKERAYYLYVERGSEAGHDLEDWLRAEREMTVAEIPAAQPARAEAVLETVRQAVPVRQAGRARSMRA